MRCLLFRKKNANININIFTFVENTDKTCIVFSRVGGERCRQTTSQSSAGDYLRERSPRRWKVGGGEGEQEYRRLRENDGDRKKERHDRVRGRYVTLTLSRLTRSTSSLSA